LQNTIKLNNQVKNINLLLIILETKENELSIIFKKSTLRKRIKGACGYFERNKTTLLDVVEELFSLTKEE
jgi:hypothetical protein